MTEGPIWKSLVSFAVPIFFGNLFQQLYNTADSIIVGNFIGKEALAAVGSSTHLIFLLIGFLHGVSMGAGVLIAKYYGAGDRENLQKGVHTIVAFGALAGLVLTVVGVTVTPFLLRLMGTPDNVLPSSVAYFRTYFMGAVASVLYNFCTGILQAVGDSRHPLHYLIASSLINIGLDLLFVAVLGFGVASAALATVISQCVAATLCIRQLLRTSDVHRLEIRKIRLDPGMLALIVRFGLPAGVQNSLVSFANVMVQSNINAFGDSAMAGSGSYSKIEGFAFLPITAFAMALATFMGQNLGAKQYERAKKGARFGVLCAMLVAELVGVVLWFSVPWLVRLFNTDPEVIAYGVRHCRTVSLFYGLLALNNSFNGVLRGAGRPGAPMVIMMASWCGLRIAYITVLVSIFHDIFFVFSAYPVTWAVSGVLFLIYYFRVDWLHTFDRLEQQEKSSA